MLLSFKKQIIGCMILVLLTAYCTKADRRGYVWTYEYMTMPKGHSEVEYYMTHKAPDFHKWAAHIDGLLHVDNREPEEIAKVIEWCQRDRFWQNTILSTEKLRKQFSQLYLKMNENQPKIKIGQKDWDPYDREWYREEFGEEAYKQECKRRNVPCEVSAR